MRAQGHSVIVISKPDTSAYPSMRAALRFVGAQGTNQAALSRSDLELRENGQLINDISLSCPPPTSAPSLSSVLVMDVSGSMWSGSPMNIELAREAGRVWVDMLRPGSECAVVSFDSRVYLNQDFTEDHDKLNKVLAGLQPRGGTDYAMALYQERFSALNLLSTAKHKPIVVFLTDGLGRCSSDTAIALARKYNAEVYCVCVRMPALESLSTIAKSTGGFTIDKVVDMESIRRAYVEIFSVASNQQSCELRWTAQRSCSQERVVQVRYLSESIQSSNNYVVDPSQLNGLTATPSSIRFVDYLPNMPIDTTLSFVASADSTRIDSISSSNSVFRIVGAQLPVLLMKGERWTSTLRCLPTDSSIQYGLITLKGNFCSPVMCYARVGSLALSASQRKLQLVSPNGGERLAGGCDYTLRWVGALPDDTLRLEYSIDKGQSWSLISDSATNFSYNWHVPWIASQRCLVRISQLRPRVVADSVQIIRNACPTAVLDLAFSPDGDQFTNICATQVQFRSSYNGTSILPVRSTNVGSLNAVAWSSESNYIATVGNSGAAILYAGSGALRDVLPSSSLGSQQCTSCDFSADSKYLYIATNLAHVFLWQMEETPVNTNAFLNLSTIHSSSLRCVRSQNFNASSDTNALSFATASEDRRMSLSTARINTQNGTLSLSSMQAGKESYSAADQMWSLSCCPSDTRIAGGALNGELIIGNSGSAQRFIPVPNDGITQCVWSPDSKFVALGYNSGRIVIWEVATQRVVRQLDTNHATLLALRWDPQGTQLAAGYFDGSLLLWRLGPQIEQQDRSDAIFSIEIPELRAQGLVDFGTRDTGSSCDTLLTSLLCHDTHGITANWTLSDVQLMNDVELSFQIVNAPSGLYRDSVASCLPFEIACQAHSSGTKNASLRFKINDSVIVVQLRVQAADPALRLASETIDFGQIVLGAKRDSTVILSIPFNSSDSVELRDLQVIGPDTTQFNLLSAPSALILPGNAIQLQLRFRGLQVARTSSALSGVVSVLHAGQRSAVPLYRLLYAEVLCGSDSTSPLVQPELSTVDSVVRLGEATDLSVSLKASPQQLYQLQGSGRVRVSFHSSTLSLLQPTDPSIADGQRQYLWLNTLAGDTALRLRCLPLLGDTNVIELSIDSLDYPQSCGLRFGSARLVLPIANLCMAGGTARLLQTAPLTVMNVWQHTSQPTIEIHLSLAEKGRTQIRMFTLLGDCVTEICDKDFEVGNHQLQFSLNAAASGVYAIELQTPSERKVVLVSLMR